MDTIEPRKKLATLHKDSHRLRVWVALYLFAIILVTSLIFWDSNRRFYQQVDRQLLLGAQAVPSMLPPDFHDRATHVTAISREEFLAQVRHLSDLASVNEFRYLYTIIRRDGRIYFTSYSLTPEEWKTVDTDDYYFLPYPDAPPELHQTFENQIQTYANYTDRWGSYRSVFVPSHSPSGNLYVIGADYDSRLLRKNLLMRILVSLGIGLLAGLAAIPILLGQYKAYRADTQFLADWSDSLAREVERRTQELSREIADRELFEKRQAFTIRLLERIQQPDSGSLLVRDILQIIKEFTGLEQVGMRRREGTDFVFLRLPPPDAASDLPESQVTLTAQHGGRTMITPDQQALACLCGAVIEKKTDPHQPYFTPKGSFFTGQFPETCAQFTKNHPKTVLRNHCLAEGIQTLALIPISDGSSVIGLLHLADSRPQRISLNEIHFLENVGITLGMALHRNQLLEDINASRNKYIELFNAMTSAFALHEIILDEQGHPVDYRFIDANPAFCKLLGHSQSELIGHTAKTIFPLLEPDWVATYADVALSGTSHHFEKHFALLNKTFDILAYSPQRRQFATIITDITEPYQNRLALEASHKNLEKALADLHKAQHIIVQQERLAALGQLVSGLSHDFNNSLMPIRGLTQFLLDTPELFQNPTELRRLIAIIAGAGRDAAAIVQRLKDIFSPPPDLQIQKIDAEFILDDILAMARPRWEQATPPIPIQTEIIINGLDSFWADEIQLREAFMNLILNAADAMPQGGKLILSAGVEGDQAVLSVIDTGLGMTPEVREKCIEPFYTTKGNQGTGIGLSMVHQTVIRHGGTLEIQSAPGQGSTVRMLLPLNPPLPLPAESMLETPPQLARTLKILVIDDDAVTNEVLRHFLVRDGHDVVCLTHGREIGDRFAETVFDLVITDRIMPDFSGEEVIRWVKSHHPNCPVVLITGLPITAPLENHDPSGADICLEKPITAKQLRDIIANLFNRPLPPDDP